MCILANTHTHQFNGFFPGLPVWAGTRKVKPIWILLKQETVSGSDISWAICKSAPRSKQITIPAPHHSVFYRPDALPAAQPTASKHWRQCSSLANFVIVVIIIKQYLMCLWWCKLVIKICVSCFSLANFAVTVVNIKQYVMTAWWFKFCATAATSAANHHKICFGVLQYYWGHGKEHWNHRAVRLCWISTFIWMIIN